MSREYRQPERDGYHERYRRSPPRDKYAEVKREFDYRGRLDTLPPKELPNFEVSGVLADDQNQINGVALNFALPPDSARASEAPGDWRMYEFKGDDSGAVVKLYDKACYLVGSDPDLTNVTEHNEEIEFVKLEDSTVSRQHAVVQFRRRPNGVLPYLLDLGSTNGSFLNESRIEPGRYIELRNQDVVRFGRCDSDYVILHARAGN